MPVSKEVFSLSSKYTNITVDEATVMSAYLRITYMKYCVEFRRPEPSYISTCIIMLALHTCAEIGY